MPNVTDDKVKGTLEKYFVTGECHLADETLNRYKRIARQKFPEWYAWAENTTSIQNNYTPEEMKILAKGGRIIPTLTKKIDFSGRKIKIGACSDMHAGSIYFKPYIWEAFVKATKDCDIITLSGDITEGMAPTRIDAVYELTHIGYDAQKDYAVQLLSMINKKKPIYTIDGNHDRWYKRQGACIVKDICKELSADGRKIEYLGEDEGHLKLKGAQVWLWHGQDGGAYAFSYRLQKLIESFAGGAKPHVIFAGHDHKAMYLFPRNVHALAAGAIVTQSRWMRSTKKENHTGFWTIELTVNDSGVSKIKQEWFPMYE